MNEQTPNSREASIELHKVQLSDATMSTLQEFCDEYGLRLHVSKGGVLDMLAVKDIVTGRRVFITEAMLRDKRAARYAITKHLLQRPAEW